MLSAHSTAELNSNNTIMLDSIDSTIYFHHKHVRIETLYSGNQVEKCVNV